MTEEKSVGKFEQLMLRVITIITMVYLASAQTFIELSIPSEIALVFVSAVAGYFFNRFVLKFEDWVNARLILAQLKQESDDYLTSTADPEFVAAMKDKIPEFVDAITGMWDIMKDKEKGEAEAV